MSQGEPPSKRSKTGANPARSSRGRDEDSSKNYLSCFDVDNPIAVVVTPLRKRQGSILARNLSEAGANVVDLENPCEGERSNPGESRLVIVTDAKSKAEIRLASSPRRDSSVRYVSTKWASKVLSAEIPFPVDPFVLSDTSNAEPSPRGKSDTTLHTSADVLPVVTERNLLPVWCTRSLPSTCDISEKEEILRRLPPFLCQRSTLTQSLYPSPNKALCEVLEQLAKKRVLERAGGSTAAADIRARAYRLASAALKCVPFKLQTKQDGRALRSFGPRVLAVVNEFLMTGAVAEVEHFLTDVRFRTMAAFQEMYGIGATTARELYDGLGITSVKALRERVATKPGEFSEPLVEYMSFFDELKRMNLTGARAFRDGVETVVNGGDDGGLQLRVVLCGGFRRGEAEGHDVDLVYCRRVSKRDETRSVLDEVTARLRRAGLLVAVLGYSADRMGWEEKRYSRGERRSVYRFGHDVLHGLGRWDGRVFRVDVVGVRDAAEMAFATLAWSGSTGFQRDLRLACERIKGWIFNQHGVFEEADGTRVRLRPAPQCEMDVFHAVGLVYRAPFERSC